MDKVTWEEFAAALKQKFPEYKDIPDTQFVDAVLTQHPEWKSKVYGANVTEQQRAQLSVPPAIPKPRGFEVNPVRYGIGATPEQEAGPDERRLARREAERQANEQRRFLGRPSRFLGRVSNRVASQGEALSDTVTALLKSSEPGTPEFKELMASLRHPQFSKDVKERPLETAGELTATAIPPIGLARDWLRDPANMAGDVLTGYAMGAAHAPGDLKVPEDRYSGGTNVVAGKLRGAYTRSALTMDRLDALAKDKPIEYSEPYKLAQKAIYKERYGTWKAPEWMHKYVEMIDSGLQGGKDPIPGRPGEFVDRAPSMNPLTYEHARNFEVAAGGKIDWDDPGDVINALQKQARKALGKNIAAGLKPFGWDRPYLQAKADFTKAYGANARWGLYGKWGGRLAGFTASPVHPFMVGYAGGKLGESIAGQLVRSITHAGERGGAETPSEIGSRYIRSQTAPPSNVEDILRSPADRPPASPRAGINMVPPESRASAEALRVAQENVAKKVSTRGAAKQAMEKGSVAEPAPLSDVERLRQEFAKNYSVTGEPTDFASMKAKMFPGLRELTNDQMAQVVQAVKKAGIK
jgi:hypothetical protein